MNYDLLNYIRDNVRLRKTPLDKQNNWKADLTIKLRVKKEENLQGELIKEYRPPNYGVMKFEFKDSLTIGKNVEEERINNILGHALYHQLDAVLHAGLMTYGYVVVHVRGVVIG